MHVIDASVLSTLMGAALLVFVVKHHTLVPPVVQFLSRFVHIVSVRKLDASVLSTQL
jgi:hypothetical protein